MPRPRRNWVFALTAALVLACVTTQAHAGWIQSVGQAFAGFDQWRLDHTPPQFTGPRPGRDFTMLAVHNNTNRPIQFAACWVPWQNPYDNSSHLEYVGNGPWAAQAWYRVMPGQVVHFGNTISGTFYVFAYQEGTPTVWSGGAQINFPGIGPLGCNQYMFAFLPLEYTVHLNP